MSGPFGYVSQRRTGRGRAGDSQALDRGFPYSYAPYYRGRLCPKLLYSDANSKRLTGLVAVSRNFPVPCGASLWGTLPQPISSGDVFEKHFPLHCPF